jgi:hypothetical protein
LVSTVRTVIPTNIHCARWAITVIKWPRPNIGYVVVDTVVAIIRIIIVPAIPARWITLRICGTKETYQDQEQAK